ncbi:MAG: ferrous iron transport protein A [Clostridia bacterium]|nr:ferrous iron transport protein A [Clostridia bacterium]
MPLTMSPVGKKNCIRKIVGNDGVRQHLAELGFVVGVDVTVVSEISGNMILSIKDTRVALNKAMADRILI